ncbi:MAG: membrane dipeptidase [Vicinamibacterales bacterium]
MSQLTYNTRNLISNGAFERQDDGISDFGVAIIERMNKAGMAVDVSHCGDRTRSTPSTCRVVTAQADEDAAWRKAMVVKRPKSTSLSIPAELALEQLF